MITWKYFHKCLAMLPIPLSK